MAGNVGIGGGGFQLRDRRTAHAKMMMQKENLGLVAGGVTIGLLLIVMYHTLGFNDVNGELYGGGMSNSRIPPNLRNLHPHPHLRNEGGSEMGDSFNAIAKDILDTLDCATLFNISTSSNPDEVFGRRRRRRRRLDEEESAAAQHGDDGGFLDPPPDNNNGFNDDPNVGGDGGGVGGGLDDDERTNEGGVGGELDDDVMNGEMAGDWNYVQVTAKHLFCVAAYDTRAPKEVTDQLQCDAENTKRQTLLDLWSAARAQFPSSELLVKVLDAAKEQTNQLLLERMYHLWAPDMDDGLSYMLGSLNDETNIDHGMPVRNLKENLIPDQPGSQKRKLFVDVGSCTGLTTLAVNHLYSGTKIVSIEPAHPNWLLQELNIRCNLSHDELRNIHVVLGGVGPNTEDEDNLMGKVLWRPKATTSTRAWTPREEHGEDDIELVIKLRRLSSLLAEANVYGQPIDVLNVDCEGCEYNLVPAMTEEEFDAIPAVIGSVHWYV